jgi:hypothetical protein
MPWLRGRSPGNLLYVAGSFALAGDAAANGLACWDGSTWSSLGGGLGDNSDVSSITAFDSGTGPGILVAGSFDKAGGISVANIARWDGATWSNVGGGISSTTATPPRVLAMTTFLGGSTPILVVGGTFTTAGSTSASNIARWNGTSWAPFGTGANGSVTGLSVFDDGSGERLIAWGSFSLIDGSPLSRIASWDGSTWSAVGNPFFNSVKVTCVFDDGSGPALFAAGLTTANSWSVAKLNGATWTPIGNVSGTSQPSFTSMVVANTNTPSALWLGGSFTHVGSVATEGLASWNGTAWTSLPQALQGWDTPLCTSLPKVEALAALDLGGRRQLVVGGTIGRIGPVPSNGIGRRICTSSPASFLSFGPGCAGTAGVPALSNNDCSLPWTGTTLRLELRQLPPGQPAMLSFGTSNASWGGLPLPVSFAGIGMPGCFAHIHPEVSVLLVNPSGTAQVTLPIPPTASLANFTLYAQGLALDPGANPAGLTVSNASAAVIGH